MEQWFRIGMITSAHGIKGEVKVFPTTDDSARFKKLDSVRLDTGREQITLEIQSVKFFKQYVILKLKGIESRNDAEKYKNCPLLVGREDAIPLGEDEYFIADMLGMEVFTDDGERFGTLKDVLRTGANDVYVVGTPDHGDVLLPAIRDCIQEIDIKAQRMKVHLMKGLVL